MNKLDGNSMNIVNENIEKLKEIFPEIFSEGKIDFEKLQEELGEVIDRKDERYNFTWNGKAEAKKIALTPSSGTLRPCKEESKNFDTTQNLYIEGDNLEVLKLLQKSYHKKVKMIYIDPPYNTGKDFVYKDNFKDNIKNYLEITGQVDGEGNKLSTNSDTSGRYHSDWLNMMYPRLKLARNLLKDDGVIFISIDDNEVANLRKLCDEIFGEDNFVGEFIWKNKHGGGGDSPYIVAENENILVFTKNITVLEHFFGKAAPDYEKLFRYKDERGKYYLDRLDKKGIDANRPNLIYPIKCPDGTLKDISPAIWRLSENEFERRKSQNNIEFKKDKNDDWQIYTKTYLYDENGIKRKVKPRAILKQEIVGFTQNGNKEIIELFGKKLFENPKPVDLLDYLEDIILKDNDIILDFFSGSGTTAHSTMQLNSEDTGKRRYICVQIPETTDEKSEAFKSGYKNICEIGKERIKRAGKKILEDNKGKDLSNLDIGFKVLKLDSSNIKTWDSEYENLEQNLLNSIDNIKSDRTNEDLLYEILLKYGLDLTLPIEELNINGKKVFSIGLGMLIVCLDSDIDTNTVEQIAQLKKQYEEDYGLDKMRIVFKDNGFKNAVVKTNALQILKQHNINEVVSI
jgi:adenine-specific DNA-methyltransferase